MSFVCADWVVRSKSNQKCRFASLTEAGIRLASLSNGTLTDDGMWVPTAPEGRR